MLKRKFPSKRAFERYKPQGLFSEFYGIPFVILWKVDGVTGLAFPTYGLQSVTIFIIAKHNQK